MNVIPETEELLNDSNGNYYSVKNHLNSSKSCPVTPKKDYDGDLNDNNGNKVNVYALLQSFCHTSINENFIKNYSSWRPHRCNNNNNNINGIKNNCACFLHLLLLQVIFAQFGVIFSLFFCDRISWKCDVLSCTLIHAD